MVDLHIFYKLQGDSTLYILSAETLSIKLIVEKEASYIPGINIARGVDPINHALFADDSLLLGGPSLKIS